MFLLELISSSFLDLHVGETEYSCKHGLVSAKALENHLLRGQVCSVFFFFFGGGGRGEGGEGERMMLLWERNKLG